MKRESTPKTWNLDSSSNTNDENKQKETDQPSPKTPKPVKKKNLTHPTDKESKMYRSHQDAYWQENHYQKGNKFGEQH